MPHEHGELERCVYKPRNACGHQKAGERPGTDPPAPLEGAWPCRHLHFGLLASRTVITNSLVLNHPLCGTWLQQPYEIHTLPKPRLCSPIRALQDHFCFLTGCALCCPTVGPLQLKGMPWLPCTCRAAFQPPRHSAHFCLPTFAQAVGTPWYAWPPLSFLLKSHLSLGPQFKLP